MSTAALDICMQSAHCDVLQIVNVLFRLTSVGTNTRVFVLLSILCMCVEKRLVA